MPAPSTRIYPGQASRGKSLGGYTHTLETGHDVAEHLELQLNEADSVSVLRFATLS
jgi:hypothetical protein